MPPAAAGVGPAARPARLGNATPWGPASGPAFRPDPPALGGTLPRQSPDAATGSGPRSASSVCVPPEPEKTQELMRSRER